MFNQPAGHREVTHSEEGARNFKRRRRARGKTGRDNPQSKREKKEGVEEKFSKAEGAKPRWGSP